MTPGGEKGVIATGFFDNEDEFVKACQAYNGRYNIYAGRNPRPRWLPIVFENCMDTRYRQRARDNDIGYITAISLDIDPIRPKGTSATERQHRNAIDFAMRLQSQIGGWVDDSGNGAYLWFSFITPIRLADDNRVIVKGKCQQWQKLIVERYQPESHGLKIDGCFDFSRLKKVIGTLSVKGDVHRLSRFIIQARPSDNIKDAIMGMPVKQGTLPNILSASQTMLQSTPQSKLPDRFIQLLQNNPLIRGLWDIPDEESDTSRHDWELCCACFDAGITNPTDIAAILMHNPFGKFRRDRRIDYIQSTVKNLINNCQNGN